MKIGSMLKKIAVLLIIVVICSVLSCNRDKTGDGSNNQYLIKIKHRHQDSRLYNPADIIQFKGKYVATEVIKNRLAIFDDFSFSDIKHFDPKTIGKEFNGPHFLAISPGGTLLISDGWGSGIIEIEELDGKGWTYFSGIDRHFNAPHGICVDKDGWIYVGDSLNSRLVRFKNMDGDGWQVFEDKEKKIGYIREMVFYDNAVWITNSYEKIPGINIGEGANILKIDNFESGITKEIIAIRDTNLTGLILHKDTVIFGAWSGSYSLLSGSVMDGTYKEVADSTLGFGIPYGIFCLPDGNDCAVAYLGSVKRSDTKKNRGGIVIFSIKKHIN